jgi:hypothetical protein
MYQTEGLRRLFIQQSEVICNTDTPAKSVTDIDQTEETRSLQTPRVVNKKRLGVAEHYLTPAKSVTGIYQIKKRLGVYRHPPNKKRLGVAEHY